MSIIQEALRKAQKTNGRDISFKKEERFKYIQARPEAKTKNIRPLFYTLILLITLSILVAQHLPSIAKKPVPKHTPAPIQDLKTAEPVQLPVPPVVEQKPAVIPQPAPVIEQEKFTLSGIMHLEDGPRAIINNARVAEGAKIGGATVASITDDSVVLKKDGSEITLHLE